MFQRLSNHFITMRPSVRALVFLSWINSLSNSMVSVFTQIFLYQKFVSIELNVIATIYFYTGIMVGFCVPGFFAALWRRNIKQGFIWSFIITAAALLYLLYISTIGEAYLAMFLIGLGQGFFWLTVNTFELTETKANERDFYSSVLSAGGQILSLVGPAFAAALILIAGILHLGTYSLLFIAASAIYLLGFFCFSAIRNYHPEPITRADVRHFFVDRTNQLAQLYIFGEGFQQALGSIVPPLVLFSILGTALRVGVYNIFFAIFSAVCVLIVAQYRTSSNRLLIYGITTIGVALVTVFLGYEFSFIALVIYTVIEGILSPLMNVSTHVIGLDVMETSRDGSDFYATMILRDFFLWIWRCAGGFVFLCVLSFVSNKTVSLTLGMYLLAIGFVCMYAGAYAFITFQKRGA